MRIPNSLGHVCTNVVWLGDLASSQTLAVMAMWKPQRRKVVEARQVWLRVVSCRIARVHEVRAGLKQHCFFLRGKHQKDQTAEEAQGLCKKRRST
jgi:hypothetical protein